MPDARECVRLLAALDAANGLDPVLRQDLQSFLRDCQSLFGPSTAGPPETLSALPEEHPWTEVFGEMLDMTPEDFTRQREKSVPLGRMERAEDVANVIGFLASSKSGYMTGQALSVDGGLVMHG